MNPQTVVTFTCGHFNQVFFAVYSFLSHSRSALSYLAISYSYFFLHDVVLPLVANPSCLQTTTASVVSQLSLQTVPHCPPMQTSTLPSRSSLPLASLMSVSLQDGSIMQTDR